MELVHVSTLEEALSYKNKGFQPVECSFGKDSVVGKLGLDHHGPYENQLPVCLRAFGEATRPGFRSPGKYVVTGQPDADSIYAILVLEGMIEPFFPIPRDIAQLDLDPVGVDQTTEYFLRNPAFRMQFQPDCSVTSYEKALIAGKIAFQRNPLSPDIVQLAHLYEQQREERARINIRTIQKDVAFVVSDEDSRDNWHKNAASLVVQYKPRQKVVTFAGCSEEAVENLQKQNVERKPVFYFFPEVGLHLFYNKLDPVFEPGSGGRKTIGGSPRDRCITLREAKASYELLRDLVTSSPVRLT